MERDFLGLSSSVTVKEEITEDCKDSAPAGGGGGGLAAAEMHWSFSTNKAASAHPQVLSFKAATEDHRVAMKTGYDSLTGLMTISSSEPFNPAGSHVSYSGLVQKNTSSDKQGGNYHGVTTTYAPQQFDSRQLHHRRSHEVRIFPNANKTNQNISITMTTPTLHHQSFLASGAGQNVIGSAGGVPLVAPISVVPPTGPVVGSTELSRNASKTSSGPAQLTIFYGGSVCVYDDVSPEKAQAIMLLAGNGPSVAPKTPAAVAAAQVQATMPRPSGGDVFVGNNHQSHKSHNTTLGPGLPSPISVISHVGPQSGAASSSASEKAVVNFMGGFTSPPHKPEPPKVVTSLGSAPTSMITSAAPQARKASLARFLEKRKERATNASPYMEKQSPDQKASGSLDRNISTSSSAGASPLPAAS